MYTLQNQVFYQLSQLTCGVVTTTASNPGVRSSTPRTAQKIRLPRPTLTKVISSASTYVTPNSSATLTPCSINDEVNVSPSSAYSTEVDTSAGVLTAANILDPISQIDDKTSNPSISNRDSVHETVRFVAGKILGRDDPTLQLATKIMLHSSASLFTDLNKQFATSFSVLQGSLINSLNIKIDLSSEWTQRGIINDYPDSRRLTPNFIVKNYQSFKSMGSFEIDKRFCQDGSFLQPFEPFSRVPYRTFKTNRDVQAEKERNPSLFHRIKDKLFPPRPPHPISQTQQTPPTSEKLKSLITDLPPDEANKLKIAFAEGYIAANPGSNQGESSRTYRWLRTLQQVLAIAVFTAILASLMGSFGGGMFRVNVGNGNEVMPEDINVTFQDVKGVEEAKTELQEVVEFLRNPDKFVQLGGKLPKGVLLVGPPGTGKTLLARAVAGEAGVPFFHAAGPEFDEILVGQGARRVRDLFKAAKVKAPCVIFIDEIDSVGAKRTNSVLHPYANQTINQLLSEMDGFRQNEGVIVLGATNRREDLDKALLRPGRFDVEVQVPAPEYAGRKEILEYYLGRVKRGDDVDVDILARGTTGFTGADLENVVNQAALKAAIEGADRVSKKHLDFARDKVIMGPERKSRIPDEDTNKITAYHEGGHALVAHYTPESNALHKVTIIPRGHSLGHTAYIPDKEQYHITRSQLMGMMDTMMGGRAAEELIFGIEKVTSGASSDLKQATAIATHMVKEWGMSEKVGLRTIEDNSKSLVAVNELGPSTSELIDAEIKRILQESYDRAKAILKTHAKEHKDLAEALIKYETLDAEDVKAILAGQPPTTPTKNKLTPPSTPHQTPRPLIQPPVVATPTPNKVSC